MHQVNLPQAVSPSKRCPRFSTSEVSSALPSLHTHPIHLTYSPARLCFPDDRIKSLELEVKRLAETLNVFRDEVHIISKALYTKVRLHCMDGSAASRC